ncbi:MAG: hypothetical protein J6S21_06110 [Victivallales bacterium]|nr:hypothetical protein [Victivallales bacterium]
MMTGESDTADKLYDLAYIKPHSTDNLSAEYSYNFVSGAPAYNNAALGIGAASTYLGAHYVVKDPRFNHLNTGWKCGHPDGSGFTECKDNTGAEFGVITQSDASVTDATINALAPNAFREIMDYCNGDNTQIDVDWEPELELPELADISGNNISINKTFSTAYIPNKPVTSLWQLGAVHRGEPGRTVNLKEYGDAANKFKYAGGDAWILDYFRLNQLDETAPVRGRFNPNCFDAAAYDSLLSYLPYIDDVNETSIYDPLKDGCDDNIGDQYAEAQAAQTVKLADFITYDSGAVVDNKQSWSPVEAFTNFVKLSSAANVKLNDRVAESFIGCTAGLLSTRYETFTIIAAGQKVNYLMDDAEMTAVKDNAEYMRSLVNPIQIGEMGTDWYSVMGTRLQLVTVVRDCWFNTYTVVSRQKL